MAGGYTVRAHGVTRLTATLGEASIQVEDLKKINREVAGVAAAETVVRAPKRTGRLARSVRTGATKKAGVVRVGTNVKVPYANPVHWGWPAHNIRPQPFAAQAAKDTEPVWLRIYDRGVDRVLGRVEGV